jgi:hypothetical protein
MSAPACFGVSPGEASHASPSRAARSIAGSAVAPSQNSTGSAGRGDTRPSRNWKRPDDDTTSPRSSRRTTSSDSSNAGTLALTRVPIAANWSSPSPSPVWTMKRPGASVASVPTCSASSTGFQSGSRKSAPNG